MPDPTEGPKGKGRALVIGATGGIGGETARALIAHGWRVRALSRDPGVARRQASWIGDVEWVAGDAMNEADMIGAAKDVSVILHGANPPKYRDWRGLAIPMLENAVSAARASGARLISPGNIYNFGKDAWPLVSESSPQHPCSRKGSCGSKWKRACAQQLRRGVRALIVRAADFGPHEPTSWFKDAMITPGKPLRSVLYPGDRTIGHAWAYLPDFAGKPSRGWPKSNKRFLPSMSSISAVIGSSPAWKWRKRSSGRRKSRCRNAVGTVAFLAPRRAICSISAGASRNALFVAHANVRLDNSSSWPSSERRASPAARRGVGERRSARSAHCQRKRNERSFSCRLLALRLRSFFAASGSCPAAFSALRRRAKGEDSGGCAPVLRHIRSSYRLLKLYGEGGRASISAHAAGGYGFSRSLWRAPLRTRQFGAGVPSCDE